MVGFESSRPWKCNSAACTDFKHGEKLTDDDIKYKNQNDKLRAEIAREEKVPPYIVFSDKTLVQMCIEKPTNKNAMLKVSGVGEFKFEKYGERFLEVIRSWT